MSLHWNVRLPSMRERGKPPSLWIGIAIFIVVQVIGAVIMVLTWGQKPVASTDFFVRFFVLPTALSAALCACVYTRYEQDANDTDWWNYLCRSLQSRWRSWAQQRVVIVASSTVTPETDLGERMLGLEGHRLDNAGKRLPLVNQDQASSESRLHGVLKSLLTPLSDTVAAVTRAHTLHVRLQSATQDDLVELQQVWGRLLLPDTATFSWHAFETPLSLAEPWLDNARLPADFQLTLACQLHQPEQTPDWSEVAVALLTTSPAIMAVQKNKLKPLAYLFRPIVTDADQIAEAMGTLQQARQAPPDRIKHLWLSGLAGQPRHATESAIRDCGLELPAHDLDEAVGKPGPVSPLLLHALAAQMVRHGQGAQLIATSAQQGVQLGLIGNQLAPVDAVEPAYYQLFSLSMTIGLLGIACLALFGAQTLGAMPSWLPAVVLAVVVLMLPLQIGASMLCRRETTRDFYTNL